MNDYRNFQRRSGQRRLGKGKHGQRYAGKGKQCIQQKNKYSHIYSTKYKQLQKALQQKSGLCRALDPTQGGPWTDPIDFQPHCKGRRRLRRRTHRTNINIQKNWYQQVNSINVDPLPGDQHRTSWDSAQTCELNFDVFENKIELCGSRRLNLVPFIADPSISRIGYAFFNQHLHNDLNFTCFDRIGTDVFVQAICVKYLFPFEICMLSLVSKSIHEMIGNQLLTDLTDKSSMICYWSAIKMKCNALAHLNTLSSGHDVKATVDSELRRVCRLMIDFHTSIESRSNLNFISDQYPRDVLALVEKDKFLSYSNCQSNILDSNSHMCQVRKLLMFWILYKNNVHEAITCDWDFYPILKFILSPDSVMQLIGIATHRAKRASIKKIVFEMKQMENQWDHDRSDEIAALERIKNLCSIPMLTNQFLSVKKIAFPDLTVKLDQTLLIDKLDNMIYWKTDPGARDTNSRSYMNTTWEHYFPKYTVRIKDLFIPDVSLQMMLLDLKKFDTVQIENEGTANWITRLKSLSDRCVVIQHDSKLEFERKPRNMHMTYEYLYEDNAYVDKVRSYLMNQTLRDTFNLFNRSIESLI